MKSSSLSGTACTVPDFSHTPEALFPIFSVLGSDIARLFLQNYNVISIDSYLPGIKIKGGDFSMFCNKCGKELADGSRFCCYCGQAFASAPPVPPVAQAAPQVPYKYPAAYPPVMQQPVQPSVPYYPPYPMAVQQGNVKRKKKKGCSIAALLAAIGAIFLLIIMLTIPVVVPSWGSVTESIRNNCSTWIALFWISAGIVLVSWILLIVALATKNCSAVTVVAIVFASIALLLFLVDIPFYSKIDKTRNTGRVVDKYYDDLDDYMEY